MDNKVINIEWMSDSTDCDTCGCSFAEGAVVTIGEHVIDMTPCASCLGGDNYTEGQVYEAILGYLEWTVEHAHNDSGEEF